ncbi:MAG: hypothetical protein JXA99_04605 [Candidatus Lokiarchaeota archaeon]|nr:hypothetical protein [Candidatus Lokiarchaeota archaeon]
MKYKKKNHFLALFTIGVVILSSAIPIIINSKKNTVISEDNTSENNNNINLNTFTSILNINRFIDNNHSDKIAILLFDSDVLKEKTVLRYIEILKKRDFDLVLGIANPNNIIGILKIIDAIEGPEDMLFLYICAHGKYYDYGKPISFFYNEEIPEIWVESFSYVGFGDEKLESFILAYYLKYEYESRNKVFLIESCYSGAFVDNIMYYDVPCCLGMTSCNINEKAYRIDKEGYFSKGFFNYLDTEEKNLDVEDAFHAGWNLVAKDYYLFWILLRKHQTPQITPRMYYGRYSRCIFNIDFEPPITRQDLIRIEEGIPIY